MSPRYTDCTAGSRARTPVLDSLTLEFPTGHTVLFGPNGAGKSTPLSLGSPALAPKTVRVAWSSLDSARSRDRGECRRGIGRLPRRIEPVPGLTVREKAAYAVTPPRHRPGAGAPGGADPAGRADGRTRPRTARRLPPFVRWSKEAGDKLRRVGLTPAERVEFSLLVPDRETVLTVGAMPTEAQKTWFQRNLRSVQDCSYEPELSPS